METTTNKKAIIRWAIEGEKDTFASRYEADIFRDKEIVKFSTWAKASDHPEAAVHRILVEWKQKKVNFLQQLLNLLR